MVKRQGLRGRKREKKRKRERERHGKKDKPSDRGGGIDEERWREIK